MSDVDKFKKTGVVTINLIQSKDIKEYQTEFKNTLKKFPEYLSETPNNHVLGGFAALGNSASFHNPFVRKLRKMAYDKLVNHPLFITVVKRNNIKYNIEQLVDRMMFRQKGMSPPAESWHRDVMPSDKLREGDELYGGWINLDSKSQYFSCLLGSHLGIDPSNIDSGFATVPKDDVKALGKYKTKVEILPGSIVIFPQYILHEVVNTKKKYDMMRLFTGWRFTTSRKSLHKNMKKMLKNQEPIPLPGGMKPPLYAKNHMSYFLNKQFIIDSKKTKMSTIEWSNDTFKPSLLVTKIDKNGNNYQIIPRYMKGLKELGLTMYDDYSNEELKMYKPQSII